MTTPQPYRLMIKTVTSSKAKFLRIIPMKSFVEGEKFEISFRIENIGEEVFPGGELHFRIEWPSGQQDREHFPILPLKKNQTCITKKFLGDALSSGFGLVFIQDMRDGHGSISNVEYYSGKRVEDRIEVFGAIYSIKTKSWEEIYEFWALIVATISLAIIALEKVLLWLIRLFT